MNSNQNKVKLKESEERYTDLFLNSNDLIQSIDAKGRFVYVNPTWLNTLGYSEEEVLGMAFLDIIHDSHKAPCMDIFGRIQKGEKFDFFEVTFVTKSGKDVIVEGTY